MPDLVPIRRALISVSDKAGLEPLVRALASRGVEIVSTGGTARHVESLGVRVTPIESVTGFPEMMDGRVKTLHPKVHGGLLAVRDNPAHARAMSEHAIVPIDLVCISLYPFEQTVAKGAGDEECVEQIDIGGPAMIRSAAKNHAFVTVVTDSHQYGRLMNELDHHNGSTTFALRRQFAGAAYARTAAYDTAIAAWFGAKETQGVGPFPEVFRVAFPKHQDLRYGENPHQRAALYRDPGFRAGAGHSSVVGAVQMHGKELSYNNLNDAAAALALCDDLADASPGHACACVIKHANPCGASSARSVFEAVDRALAGDPVAAFGGILAASTPIDLPAAQRLAQEGAFLEVILAPGFAPDALDVLRARWANVRLMAIPPRGQRQRRAAPAPTFRAIQGGLLVQEPDDALPEVETWAHAAGPKPSAERLAAAAGLWTIVKHLASNAVVVGAAGGSGGVSMLGGGAGQMDRVTSCRLSVEKAGARLREAPGGAIACSDAFFPFPDGPQVLIDAGVTMIVHAGGSKRDHETFDLCERRGVTCLTTGVRHFRH
ncbi:MAG: bifunctional phosphoribosylaminoimidazolecarboxamide formyltransferase/IMP cyclohydrolase [Planctomycetes bacterium]|nr:bifunctional phosphoribosylaminoimidazolecarboxamide formyltransferase/IMP cyclohydrolase [Planctomycetota bacterium]